MRRLLPRARPGGIGSSGLVWPLLGAGALWLPPALRWARAWVVAPDQAFGWGVPLLAAYLWAERWRTAPAPNLPAAGRAGALAVFAVGCLLVLTSLPVLEANALWPTAQWWSVAGAVAATLGALAWAGGWRWASGFAFPPLFIFTALTWPTPIKSWTVNTLSGLNAQIAAGIVSAAGHPAVVSGNVIAVSTGLVGIEEACSGLRSLQTVWMVAWFAGEFFLLNLPRRLFLVFVSVGVALGANLARTIFLTWTAASAGLGASERWHDRAGNAELAFDLAVVAALAWRGYQGAWKRRPRRLDRPWGPLPARGEADIRERSRTDVAERSRGPGVQADRSGEVAASTVLLPLRGLAIIACLVGLAAELGTRAWYRAHARAANVALTHWRLSAPSAGWRPEPVPAREIQVLQSTAASGLSVRPPVAAFPAWVFVVSWEGDAARSENPEWHDPSICLPASGARLVADLGVAAVPIGGRTLQFAGYRFTTDGRPETVYFCHWDAETANARVEANGSAGDVRARRWQRVAEGRRQGDVAHIAIVMETADSAAALAWLRQWAPVFLRPVAG